MDQLLSTWELYLFIVTIIIKNSTSGIIKSWIYSKKLKLYLQIYCKMFNSGLSPLNSRFIDLQSRCAQTVNENLVFSVSAIALTAADAPSHTFYSLFPSNLRCTCLLQYFGPTDKKKKKNTRKGWSAHPSHLTPDAHKATGIRCYHCGWVSVES